MKKLVLALLVVLFVAADLQAWPRWRARRYHSTYTTGYTTSYATAGYVGGYSSPQAAAEAKASIQANAGSCFHPGGGFGGAYAEGVGMGATAQQALNNCCFTGQRTVAGSCVVQGANGWFYACKTYW